MAQELSTSTLITWECPVVRPDSNQFPLFSLLLSLRWQLSEEPPKGATKLHKDDRMEIKSEGSLSTSLKLLPCHLLSYHCNHHPPPGSCCSSSLHADGVCSELERGSVLPLLELPLNHRLVRMHTAVRWSHPTHSWCPLRLCLWGSTEPSREEVGLAKSPMVPSDSWCHTTECWSWTCPVCLPVCPTVCLCMSVCLSVILAVNLHQVP